MMTLEIILIILFYFAKTERDIIAHNSRKCLFPGWDWYVGNNWKTHSFWLKNVFTMFLDGWHFWEFVNTSTACLLFGIAMNDLWLSLVAYVIGGGLMDIRSGSLFRKGLKM